MKKLILIVAVLFSASTLLAQSTGDIQKKDTFVMNDNLIEATLYHPGGEIAQTGYYTTDNKLQGEWISYDTEGNKTAVANYEDGEKVGTWLFYQGETIKEVSYVDSKVNEVKTWKVTDTRVVTN